MIYRFHFFSFHHSIISSRCRFLFWPRYYFYLFQECHITENVHFIITDIIIVIVTYINVVIYFIDSYIITTYISITYVLIYITITFIITFIVIYIITYFYCYHFDYYSWKVLGMGDCCMT